MKGQIVPGNRSAGQGFLVYEAEDGTHHEITNCFRADGEPLRGEYVHYGEHSMFIPRPPVERVINAEFRVSEYTMDDTRPAKQDYDYEATVVEDAGELPSRQRELPAPSRELPGGVGWPE